MILFWILGFVCFCFYIFVVFDLGFYFVVDLDFFYVGIDFVYCYVVIDCYVIVIEEVDIELMYCYMIVIEVLDISV